MYTLLIIVYLTTESIKILNHKDAKISEYTF